MELDDGALLAAAAEAGTAPLMHLSTLTESGGFSNELAHLALTDQALQDTLIDNLEAMLLRKATGGWMLTLSICRRRMPGPTPLSWPG